MLQPVDNKNTYDTPNVTRYSSDRDENTNSTGVFQFVSCEVETNQEFEEEEVLNEYCSSKTSELQHRREQQENSFLSSEEEDEMDESISWKKVNLMLIWLIGTFVLV